MPYRPRRPLFVAVFIVFAGLFTAWPALAGKVPDFTRGDNLPAEAQHTWNLGATGARGWIYSDRMVTTDARQIYITQVDKGSPADGVLEVGDVILGVGGKAFSYDPRPEFGKALTYAESNAGRGRLELTRWRKGQTQEVVVDLPVLGTYSDTAPYGCTKSRRILRQGCEALVAEMEGPRYRRNPIERSLNALALLASGDPKYLPLVRREAQWAAEFSAGGFKTWYYGYVIMLLSEYVMQTGDQSVMLGLQRLALEAANGQSVVGSWGHNFARENGVLGGYGMMNAPGLTLTTGLILAREAGVDSPVIDKAIDKSVLMLRFYVGKGSIPYGDHEPWIQNHDDNGKNSIAAVMFNLLGDREATEYFSHMSIACYGSERDTGHTGNFWNILWALPGINQSGPYATGAWMEEFGQWYFDTARTWKGTFVHLGPPGESDDKYGRWDCTGAYLLAYAMPLKKLRLTGKGRSVAPRISTDEARSLIEDGRGWDNKDRTSYYDAMSTEQLLDRLSSWSPVVRDRAGMALGRRKAQVVPQLIQMLGDKDLHTRQGACTALSHLRVDRAAAVPALRETLSAEDLWLRILSAEALASIGEPARVAAPDMLLRLAKAHSPDDPRQMEQRYLCFALFDRRGGLIARSIEGVDRDLLFQAVRVALQNQDGKARGSVGTVFDRLSFEEIRPLLPAIHQAVIKTAPSGIMFADGVRLAGLKLLAKHHVAEGIDAAVTYLDNQNDWGAPKRTPDILKSLVSYGAHAQRVIPELERLADEFAAEDAKRRPPARNHLDQAVREAIEQIKASDKKPDLTRLEKPRVG